VGVCGYERGRDWERERDCECRGDGVSNMSPKSSCGIIGIARRSKEFRLGISSGTWSELCADLGVVTCGVYSACPDAREIDLRRLS